MIGLGTMVMPAIAPGGTTMTAGMYSGEVIGYWDAASGTHFGGLSPIGSIDNNSAPGGGVIGALYTNGSSGALYVTSATNSLSGIIIDGSVEALTFLFDDGTYTAYSFPYPSFADGVDYDIILVE